MRNIITCIYQKATIFVITIFLSSLSSLNSQDTIFYTIEGKITCDSPELIAYSSLALLRQDSSIYKGTIIDSLGNYSFEYVKSGKYFLKFISLNKEESVLRTISASGEKSQIKISDINVVIEDGILLNELIIKAKKPFIERRIDRTIVNLQNSTLAIGNSVHEILNKLPGVSVRNENEISVNGVKGVAIYVDGKGRSLSTTELVAVLESIQAENVQKIEIFSTPPARFDANQNAVINIVTKKEKMRSRAGARYGQLLYPIYEEPGFSYYSHNINSNLHSTFGKLNLNYSLNLNARRDIDITQQEDKLPTLTRKTILNSETKTTTVLNSVRAIYKLNEKNELFLQGKALILPLGSTVQRNENNSKYFSSPIIENFNSRFENRRSFGNYDFLLNYSKVTDKKDQLSLDVIFGKFIIDNNLKFFVDNESPLSQKNENALTFKALRFDYNTSLENMDFETGLKISNLNNSNTINNLTNITNFTFVENISAAYLSMNKKINQHSFKAGIRAEYTLSKGLDENSAIKNQFLNIFPNLYYSTKIGKQSYIKTSYSRRIRRPSFEHYNPNAAVSNYDQYTIISGNPSLQPQITSKYEIDFSYGKFNILSNYVNEKNVRANYLNQDNLNEEYISLITTSVDNQQIGLRTSYQIKIREGWESYNNFQLTFYKFEELENNVQESLAFFLTNSNTILISKGVTLDAFIMYRSGFKYNYFELGGQFIVDISCTYKLDKFQIKIALNNLTGTTTPYWNSNYGQVKTIERYLTNNRQINMSFSYNFYTGEKYKQKNKSISNGEIR